MKLDTFDSPKKGKNSGNTTNCNKGTLEISCQFFSISPKLKLKIHIKTKQK